MLAFSSPRGQDEAAANVAQIFSRHCELLLARSAAEESLRVVLAQMDADVTGRTQELREAVEMLQRQVTERLKVERELRDERDSSHSNVAAKAAFLASMSHEIRTPMNGLLGMLTLLRHSALQRDQSEYLARAMESGDTLLRVVNDILDLSKIEAGRMSLELESLDLCDLLEGCAQSAAPAAAAKGVEVAVEYADAPAFELMGDSVRLRQLINNFVVNAIKYTDTGNITLAVKVENESAHEVTLHLAVRDTGCGIPANQAARVFEKYTQCEQDNEFGAMGTGLGLAINREIARLMGAEIGVESVPGVGSEFWLRLTLAKADTDCEWASGEMVGQICGTPVLLAMPESPLRRQAEEIFTRWDMPTTATDSLAKAFAWCREQTRLPQNALLLLESGMPEAEVTALLQRLRAMQGGERIAVLELTAPNQIAQLASPETAHQCVAIFTPIRRTDLLVAITTLFGKQTQTLVASQQTDTDYDFGAVSVLVVEDNPINMQVAVGYLRKLGIEPTQATDGQQAVELSQQHTFDLILMDCYMPRMDGYQASAQIRVQERDSDRHVPIVAMTANALAGDREHCRRAGMDGYLAKPISFNQMARELRHHLVDSETGASEGTLDYAAVRTLREIMGKGFPALVGEFIFDGEQQLRGPSRCAMPV
jgi:signal transduction histidine kinase/DNA-binding response OmpR family regulator